mmetsp:Transcript_88645/g.141114  ORF Transcript_88645/g.141114 Transcript_88645/m.141114 type:complete len:287 (-) Transcript_88645:7-867(-)
MDICTGQLLSRVFQFFGRCLHVSVFVGRLNQAQHRCFSVEHTRLPCFQFFQVQHTVAIFVQFLEVFQLVFTLSFFLITVNSDSFLIGFLLRKFLEAQHAVTILISGLHGIFHDHVQDGSVGLGKKQGDHFFDVQFLILIGICGHKLLRFQFLLELQLLPFFFGLRIIMLMEIIQVLLQRQLSIFICIDLLKDGLYVSSGNRLGLVISKFQDLRQRDLAIAVLVELRMQRSQLVFADSFLQILAFLLIIHHFLCQSDHQQRDPKPSPKPHRHARGRSPPCNRALANA